MNLFIHKVYLLISVFVLLSFTGKSQTYVNDSDDLQTYVNAASPGDTFIVTNGTYNDFESTFTTANGVAGNPIVIKAETVGGVTLTGESHFAFKKSSHIVFEGFVFDSQDDNTLVKLEGCNHIRITRNVFELTTTESIKWVYIGGVWDDHTFQYTSHHNRIDHNTFQNKDTPGHYITVDGTNDGNDDYRQSQYDRIDHNYFKNNSPRAINEQESIRIGWSDMSQSSGYTLVEYNLFEDCDGDPEIVSVKSCDNTIRHNTFKGCYGTLSLRHGNRNHVEGNYFFGNNKPNGTYTNSSGGTSITYTGGIRIYGTDHVIINNYLEGLEGTRWDAPITLTQGDAIDGSSTNWSKHFRAERVTIAYNTLVNNTYGIEIGFDNNGNYNKSLEDITIANNVVIGSENDLVNYVDGNTNAGKITWLNNIFYPTGNATLTNDGSTFDTAEVQVMDPLLNFDGTVWKSTANSPKNVHNINALTNIQDIEGQNRPNYSTVGADHFSMDSVLFAPITTADVGPNSYTLTSTKLHLSNNYSIKIYPVPASSFLKIEDLTNDINLIQIFNISGQKVLEQSLLNRNNSSIELNINYLQNGLYFIHLSGEKGQFTQKILINK
ncbi:MAG: chondroitinase-B domain-containing protein [Saprospiraceae bacterium]